VSFPVRLRVSRRERARPDLIYLHIFLHGWAYAGMMSWLYFVSPVLLFWILGLVLFPMVMQGTLAMLLAITLGSLPALAAGAPVWAAIFMPLTWLKVGPRIAALLAIVPSLLAGIYALIWLLSFVPQTRLVEMTLAGLMVGYYTALPGGLIAAITLSMDPEVFPDTLD
jgi:hypothetical protein